MKRPIRVSTAVSVLLLLNRLSLGLYFGFAGLGKVQAGVEKFYNGAFTAMKPLWLPDLLAKPYGYALPYLELIFGFTLAIGLFGRISAGAVTFMLVSIMIAQLLADKFFSGPGPFHTNVILLTIAVLLTYYGSGAFSLDGLINKRGRGRR